MSDILDIMKAQGWDVPSEQIKSITKRIKANNTKQTEETESIENELIELAQRLEQAKTEKMEQQAISEKLKNARLRGELIDREKVYNGLFLYLDKLHSNIERLADSYLSDVGALMIDSRLVLPEHRTAWKDAVMEQIDQGKKDIVKNIKEIEKDASK